MTQQATTPFANTAAASMLAWGAPIVQVYDVTSYTTVGGTITLAASQPFRHGRLRVKTSALNAAATPSIGAVSVTDGTNVVNVANPLLAAGAAGVNFDVIWDFWVDINATSISFPVTIAAAGTINSELFANP
jgi:hypothetical protein